MNVLPFFRPRAAPKNGSRSAFETFERRRRGTYLIFLPYECFNERRLRVTSGHLHKLWYDRTQELCQKFDVGGRFRIGKAGERKIAVALTYLTYQSGLLTSEEDQIPLQAGTMKKMRLYVAAFKIWLEYFIFWLIWPFFRPGTPFKEKVNNTQTDLWIVNGTNSVDLFPNIEKIFPLRKIQKISIPNKHLLKKLQSLSRSLSLIDPIFPSFTILRDMLLWIWSNDGSSFLQQHLSGYQLTDPERLYMKLADQLLRLFYHRGWAIHNAQILTGNTSTRIVLLENDFFGNLMFLAEELNNRGFQTIHVQHGFMDDPHHYYPLCKYIFVNSEKDKNLLVSEGLDSARAIITGAPLQVLLQEQGENRCGAPEYDFVILAAWGNPHLQEQYIHAIRENSELFHGKRVLLRLHPSHPAAEKNNWISKLNDITEISNGSTLLHDLNSANVVISFSIDAMITSMRFHKPTIMYIGEPSIYYRSLETIQGLACVYNSSEMGRTLCDIEHRQFALQCNDNEMEKVFGSYSVDVVKHRMNDFINSLPADGLSQLIRL